MDTRGPTLRLGSEKGPFVAFKGRDADQIWLEVKFLLPVLRVVITRACLQRPCSATIITVRDAAGRFRLAA